MNDDYNPSYEVRHNDDSSMDPQRKAVSHRRLNPKILSYNLLESHDLNLYRTFLLYNTYFLPMCVATSL